MVISYVEPHLIPQAPTLIFWQLILRSIPLFWSKFWLKTQKWYSIQCTLQKNYFIEGYEKSLLNPHMKFSCLYRFIWTWTPQRLLKDSSNKSEVPCLGILYCLWSYSLSTKNGRLYQMHFLALPSWFYELIRIIL